MKTRIFHLGDYRRATIGPGQDIPDDYFFVNGTRLLILGVSNYGQTLENDFFWNAKDLCD